MKRSLNLFCIFVVVLSATILIGGSLPQVPSGSWVVVSPMNSARSGAATVLLQDGRILVTGGDDATGPTNTAEFFGSNASFSLAAPMNTARSGHVAVILRDGSVLVAGGTTSGGGITNSAEIFNPATSTWTNVTGGMVEARVGHTATLLNDGRVFLAGGAGSSATISLSAEIFDPASQTFALAGQLASARKSHAAALLSDGRVLIVGGFDGVNVLATSDIYDPTAGTISAGSNLAVARQGLSATTLLDGRVLIAGGNNTIVNADGSSSPVALASAEILDAGATGFSPAASALLTARSGHQAFLLPHNNSVLIVGGVSNGVAVASAELFVPWGDNFQTGVFQSTGLMTTPRSSATGSALQQDGLLLVAGGKDAAGAPLSSSELYGFATIKTDADDYPPGSTVTMTGSGWQPGETVTLSLVELPYIDTHGPFTAVADANGNIFNNQFVVDPEDSGIRFYLNATGSVSRAQMTFTDNKNLVITFAGTGTGLVALADTTAPGNNANCSGNPCTFAIGNSDVGTLTASSPGGSTFVGWSAQSAGVTSCVGSNCNFSMGNNNQSVTATFNKTNSTTTVSTSGTPSNYGTPVTFTATVTRGGSAGAPSGTVTFKDGAATLGTGTLGNCTPTVAGNQCATLTNSATPWLSATTHAITAIYGGDSNFSTSTSGAISQMVNTAPVTASVAASNKVYDGTAAATITGCTLTGVAAGDTANVTCSAGGPNTFSDKNVASGKTVTATGITLAGSASGNYQLSSTSATTSADITAKALTYGGPSVPASRTYDGTTNATVSGAAALQSSEAAGNGTTADGKPYSVDTVTLTGTATGSYNTKDVATATTVTFAGVSLTGTGNGNYSLTPLTQTATITKKALTYSGPSVAASKVYDGTSNATVSGAAALQSSEAAGTGTTADGKPYSVDTVTLTGTATGTYNSKDVATAATVSFAGVFLSGTGNGNYTLTVLTQAATITAKALTYGGLSVPASRPYDGTTNATVSGSATLLSNEAPGAGTTADGKPYTGDSINLTGTATGSYNTKDVATATTVTFAGGSLTGTGNGNYTLTVLTQAATITAKALTYVGLSAPASRPYDGTTNATVSGAAALQSSEAPGAGSTADGKPYNVDAVNLTGTATGSYNTKDVATATTVTFAGGSLTGTGNGNYSLTASAQAATITAVTLTYTANAANRVYNSANPAFTGTVTGFVGTDNQGNSTTGALVFSSPATTTSDVGSYAINGSGLTANSGNYIFAQAAANATALTITKLTPTFLNLSASQSVSFGTPTISLSGRVNGYPMMPGTVTITINAGSSTPISLSGNPNNFSTSTIDTHAIPASATPYTITYTYSGDTNAFGATDTSTTLTINKAHPTLTTSGGTFTYDGSAHASVGSAKGVDGTTSVAGSFVYTYTPGGTTAPTNASATPYGVSAAFTSTDSNYDNGTAPATSTITINRAHPTLTTSGGTFIYDGLAHASIGSAKGVDGTTIVAGSFVYTYTPGGSTAPMNASATPYGVSAAFTSTDQNYDNGTAPATSTITINPAHPTLTTSGGTFTYDGLAHASIGSAKGVDGTTNVTGSFVYTYTPGGSTAPMNASATPYGVSAAFTSTDQNYDNGTAPATSTITINRAHPTLTTSGGTFTYDGSAHASVGSAKGVDGTTSVAGSFVYTYTPGGTTAPTNASATPYGVSAAFTSTDQNYDNGTAPATSTITINRAHPTLTTSGGTFTYDGLAHASIGSAKGVDGTTNVTGSFVYTYTPGGSTAPMNASATPYGVSAAFTSTDQNYDNGTAPATSTITINRAHPTLTTSGGTFTYDGLAHASIGSAKGVDGTTNVTGSFVYTYTPGGSTAPMNASATPYGVSAAFTSTDQNYDNGTAPATSTITINPAHPTLTTSGGTFTYDGLAHASIGSVKGVDGTTNVTGSFVYTYTPGGSTAPMNASATPYGVSAAFTSTDQNYDNGTAPATSTITINRAHPTLTTSGGTFTYDGSAHASVGSAKGVDGTTSVAGSFVYTYTPGGTTAPTNASATPYGVSAAFTSTDQNYDNGTAPATSTITINRAHPTLTTSGGTFTYDGLAHASIGSAKGVDGTTNVTGSFVYTYTPGGSTAPMNASATPYGVSAAFTSTDQNYDNGTAPATSTITINKADAAIVVTPYNVPYNNIAHTASGTATGIGGASLSAGLDLSHTSHTDAGTYSADYWTFTDSTGNYNNVAATTITDTITKVDASITVTPYNVLYNDAAHTANGTAIGVGGAILSAGLDLSHTTHINAGTYSADYWTFTDSAGNYNNVAATTITDTITKVDASITVTPYNVPYNNIAHTASGTATGIGGANLSAGLDLSHTTHTNAGTYSADYWTFTDSTGNYNNVADTAITDTITKVDASITVTPYDVPFDGTQHTANATATGVGGATVGSFTLTGTQHTDAGTYTADAWSFSGGTNYNDKNGAVDDKISKINATVSVIGYDLPFDGTQHTASATATGLGGVSVGSFTLTGTQHTDAGTYAADPWSFSGGTNYNDTHGTVDDKINKINATVSVIGYNVPFEGDVHTAIGTATGLGGASVGTFTLTGTQHTNAGTYIADAWSFSGGTNYNDQNGTVDDKINKIDATVTVTGYNVPYNAAQHTATASATGVGGASVGSFTLTGTQHTNAGTYNADAWSFSGGTNYNDKSGTVDDKINKIDATVTVTGYNVPYNAAAHTAGGTATGVGDADLSAGLDLSNTSHTNAGTYNADGWSFSGGTNYNDTNGTVNDKINKINATVNVTSYGVPYNAVARTASGTVTGVGGADLSADLDLSHTSHTNAGNYNADFWTFTDPNGNYNNIAATTITDAITQAHLTVKADDKSKTYNGAVFSPFTTTITGFAATETVAVVTGSATYSANATSAVTAGSYTITPGVGTLWAANYDFTIFNTGTLTIGKAHLTVKADDKSKIFDGAVFSPFTATFTGFVNSETLAVVGGSPAYSANATSAVNVGSYTITPSVGTLSATNYDFTNFNTGTLTIGAWTTNGFYQPVDMSNTIVVWNTVKGGSTVPLKFNVFAGSTEKTSVSDIKSFYQGTVACSAGLDGTVDDTLLTTGGTVLRYSGTPGSDGQFIQNWQTPKQPTACYKVTMTAKDGSIVSAFFKLK